MVNMRIKRSVYSSKKISNILLVGTEERNNFLEMFIDKTIEEPIRCSRHNYKKSTFYNLGYKKGMPQRIYDSMDMVIFFIDYQDKNSIDVAYKYLKNTKQLENHMVVYVNSDDQEMELGDNTKFFRSLKRIYNDHYEFVDMDEESQSLYTYITKIIN